MFSSHLQFPRCPLQRQPLLTWFFPQTLCAHTAYKDVQPPFIFLKMICIGAEVVAQQ